MKVQVVLPHELVRAGADQEYPDGWIGVAELDKALAPERLVCVMFGRHFVGTDFATGKPIQKTGKTAPGTRMHVPEWLLVRLDAEPITA